MRGSVDVEKLGVGDQVGVCRPGSWDAHTTVQVVAKRTATQVVLDDGSRFNKRGNEIGGNKWRSAYLMPVDEALEQEAEEKQRRVLAVARRELRKHPWDDLTLEQCQKVQALLAEFASAPVKPQDNAVSK